MKREKIIIGLTLCCIALLTSCLKYDLNDLPEYSDTDITNIFFEYRYQDSSSEWIDGSAIVQFVTLTVTSDIDKDNNEITVSLTVPTANGTFTESERANVSLAKLVCRTYLTTAASIEPVDGSPSLGVPGDFSSPREYKVIAADGSSETWTIRVTALDKP